MGGVCQPSRGRQVYLVTCLQSKICKHNPHIDHVVPCCSTSGQQGMDDKYIVLKKSKGKNILLKFHIRSFWDRTDTTRNAVPTWIIVAYRSSVWAVRSCDLLRKPCCQHPVPDQYRYLCSITLLKHASKLQERAYLRWGCLPAFQIISAIDPLICPTVGQRLTP
jgi:hypothetical protein